MTDEIKTYVKDADRERLKDGTHNITFGLVHGGDCGYVTIQLDRHYPDELAERVARSLLHQRLIAWAQYIEYGVIPEDAIRALLATVKPAHYP